MGSNVSPIWTDTNMELLKKLWIEGVSAGAIGKLIGVSRNAVIGKKSRMGLEKRPQDKLRAGRKPKPAKKPFIFKKGGTYSIPPEVIAPEPMTDAENPGITINELKWNSGPSNCRAIISRDETGEPRYCGQHNEPNQSFCLAHCRKYFNQYPRGPISIPAVRQ